MSFSERQNNSMQQPGRFSFQHFDHESEFGIETSSGERIRKKKKPGRKPNPPSTQERKAQNRAAQKAFRAREQQRREERDQQWQEYRDEIKRLRNRLAITTYENKYLKACVLHLILAFLVHRGSIPHIWTECRLIPSNNHGEYKNPTFAPYNQNATDEAYQTHALLDMILDRQHIVDFNQALFQTSQCNAFVTSERKKSHGSGVDHTKFDQFLTQDTITLNRASQKLENIFPAKQKVDATNNNTMPTELSQQAVSSRSLQTISPSSYESTVFDLLPNSQSAIATGTKSATDQQTYFTSDSGNSSIDIQALVAYRKPLQGVIFEPPTLCSSEDLATMPPLQALHILRLQMKLGSILGDATLPSLIPTALQRVVPHDIRIDYVPGASLRDKMIIFRDYYDIDECFQFFTQQAVFLGGDVRNPQNWVVAPEYSAKFWFLSHMVVDQTYGDCVQTSS